MLTNSAGVRLPVERLTAKITAAKAGRPEGLEGGIEKGAT